jgi:hypothetical protein
MLDQNTATIIASFIAVIGTLGGAITGVLLSNNHTSKMEQLRIEQEKAKRNATIIEEVYSLLTKINVHLRDNINHERPAWQGIDDDINRVQTLIYLYLPLVRAKYDELRKTLITLDLEVYMAQQAHNPIEIEPIIREPLKDFSNKMIDIKSALEKLVK